MSIGGTRAKSVAIFTLYFMGVAPSSEQPAWAHSRPRKSLANLAKSPNFL